MSSLYFDKVSQFVERHRKGLLAIFVLLFIVSSVGMGFIKYDTDMATMLPSRPLIKRSLAFYQDSSLADTVLISLHLKKSAQNLAVDNPHAEALHDELLEVTGSIRDDLSALALGDVLSGLESSAMMQQVVAYLNYMPEMLARTELFSGKTSAHYISKRIPEIYRQLLGPGGSFMLPFLPHLNQRLF